MMKSQSKRGAFSLTELVIVLGLIGVVTAMAQPMLMSYVDNERIRALGRRLELDFALARSEAIKKRAPVTVIFDPSGTFYDIVGIDNVATVDGIQATYRVNLKDLGGQSAFVSTADFGGDASVAFDALGMPDTDGAVMISSGNTSVAMTVDKGGAVGKTYHAGKDPVDVTVGGRTIALDPKAKDPKVK